MIVLQPFVLIGNVMERLDETRLDHKVATKWYRAVDVLVWVGTFERRLAGLTTRIETLEAGDVPSDDDEEVL